MDCNRDPEIIIWLEANEYTQKCPCCSLGRISRNGKGGFRIVRHLPMTGKDCLLIVPQIRMLCKDCNATYVWTYEFIEGKQRYTKGFKSYVFKSGIGATVKSAWKNQIFTTPPFLSNEQDLL